MFVVHSKRHNGYLSRKGKGWYRGCVYNTDDGNKWYNEDLTKARKFTRKRDAEQWAYQSNGDTVIEIEALFSLREKN